MDDRKIFNKEREKNILKLGDDRSLHKKSNKWMIEASKHNYSYNFNWLGLPIIQYPTDIVAIQEIIWKTQPEIIIETGVARGGSLILSASILSLLGGNRKVIGIDIDIRAHNRKAIEKHPLSKKIKLISGSSISKKVLSQVEKIVKNKTNVMVILDSNHTHDHVLNELVLYEKFVKKNNYILVMDTIIEDMPSKTFPNRPWGKKNNPKTAVKEFLINSNRFRVDESIHNKLLITVAHNGFLKCIK